VEQEAREVHHIPRDKTCARALCRIALMDRCWVEADMASEGQVLMQASSAPQKIQDCPIRWAQRDPIGFLQVFGARKCIVGTAIDR
jgi:hypothetical protein